MKLKNIFVSTIAVLAALVGCNKEEGPSYLDEIKVTSSYVSIPVEGGSGHIKLTATDSWEATGAPDWLLVEPSRGTAGQEMDICFAAESTLDGRTCEVLLKCAGKTQRINVIQGLAVVSKATCKEVIDGPDSKNYLVTGICTKIANTQYGNWYIDDGTGEVYIYGTVDGTGKYNWSSFNIEVGDEVTVQGPKTTYNGTVELVDALFVSVNKSLIKVVETDPIDGVLEADACTLDVTLENKGDGLYVTVPEDAKDWISIAEVAGNKVSFNIADNAGKARSTILTFETKKSGKSYTAQTEISQLGRTGTLETPFTVAEAIEFCAPLTAPTTADFYVSGVISKIVYTYSEQYGTATFWISDDGTFYDDKAKDFEAYSVYWLGNEPWADGCAQIEVGANVLICGHLTNYKGTAETNSKEAFIYSINGQTDEENGIGVKASPLNIAGAIAYASTLTGNSAGNVWVRGIVSELTKYQFGGDNNYNTASFWLSDDGVYNNDLTKDFEAYSIFYMNNPGCDKSVAFPAGGKQVAVGQEIVLCGKLTNYKGTCETAQNKAYIYSMDGATE